MDRSYILNKHSSTDEVKSVMNSQKMYNHQKLKFIQDFNFLKQAKYIDFIRRMYIFGSCGNGNATVKSDIDLGIELNTELDTKQLADIRMTLNDDTDFGIETNIVIVPKNQCRLKNEILKGVIVYDELL